MEINKDIFVMYNIKYFVLYLIYLQVLETVDYLVKNSYADYSIFHMLQ